MKRIISSILACLFFTAAASEKVLIMTYVHSRPDFIKTHIDTFSALLKEDFEYVVFNDAPNNTMQNEIENVCKKLGVRCFRVPPHAAHRQSPGHRHMDGIQYSLNQIGYEHDGIVMMVDADMFLIKPFSVVDYLGEFDFIGGYQFRENDTVKVIYTSPCLTIMNMKNLPNKRTLNFDGGYIHGLACDVGGHTYYYFKSNPLVKVRFYVSPTTDSLPKNKTELSVLGYDDLTIEFILSLNKGFNGKSTGMEFHGDNYFLHYHAGGSNWPGYPLGQIQTKNTILNNYIDSILSYYS